MPIDRLDCLAYGPVIVTVPKAFSGANNVIMGTIDLNPSGYLYSAGNKRVVWWKFLALSMALPLYNIAAMSCHVVRVIFWSENEKGAHDWAHMNHLRRIAWKAVVGEESFLMERVEEFALAELSYNNADVEEEMNKPRSKKFDEGFYVAKCMQPLFHKNEYLEGLRQGQLINEEIEVLEKEISLLQEALGITPDKQKSFWETIQRAFQSNPYRTMGWTPFQINQRLSAAQRSKEKLKSTKEHAFRAERYAHLAILSQQGMLARIADASVKTEEWACCGVVWLRHKQICGLIHKVECCATACWAIDCLCCLCCVWPDARSCCCLSPVSGGEALSAGCCMDAEGEVACCAG